MVTVSLYSVSVEEWEDLYVGAKVVCYNAETKKMTERVISKIEAVRELGAVFAVEGIDGWYKQSKDSKNTIRLTKGNNECVFLSFLAENDLEVAQWTKDTIEFFNTIQGIQDSLAKAKEKEQQKPQQTTEKKKELFSDPKLNADILLTAYFKQRSKEVEWDVVVLGLSLIFDAPEQKIRLALLSKGVDKNYHESWCKS